MALQLTIHTADVAQRESALVVAADVAAGRHRTILIDGGLLGYAESVHNFIDPILRGYGYPLDHILVSHYDKDHSGGVIGLLNADNMRVVSEAISNAVANAAQWAAAGTRPQQIACGAVGRIGNDPRSLWPEREPNPDNVPSCFSPGCREDRRRGRRDWI